MMSHERAAQPPARLPFLVASFMRSIEQQRRADAEWIATFERVARSPRVRGVIKQILQETEL